MKKIGEYLKKDKVQRIIYCFALILWVILWFNHLKNLTLDIFSGVYLFQIIIPFILLTTQTIFNNKIIWVILASYLSLYSLWIIWSIIQVDILIDIHRDYSPKPFWTFKKVLNWLIMLFIISIINMTVWKMKPVENEQLIAS